MENEQLFEVGETYAFKSDLFGAPVKGEIEKVYDCLLYTSPSPRDGLLSRMPSSA